MLVRKDRRVAKNPAQQRGDLMLVMFRRSVVLAGLAAVLPMTSPAQAKTTLVMWHNHPEWKDRVEAILQKFEAAHPEIAIELEEISGPDYTPRINTALAAGEGPDLLAVNPGPEMRAAASAGYLVDLTNALDTSTLTESGLDASRIDGKVYGVPVLGAYTVGLYYNLDIFAKLGLKPPTTAAELFSLAKTLKAQGVTPMIAPSQDGTIPAFLYMLAASSILQADGLEAVRKGTRKLSDPDVLKAAYFLRDLYPYFQEGALGTPYVEGKALFALGKGAMMEGGSADYAGFTQTNPAIKLGVVPFPALEGGKPSTVTGMERVFGVNKDSKHVAEATTFLQWMLTKEPAQMVVDTITLTTTKGVVPSNNRAMQEMIEASRVNDVRVWYEFPETGNVFAAVGNNAQQLFLGEMSPEDFAKALQAAVDPKAK
jgi:raffinose/stachyose/melibiose transport system substrate-binding protein